MVTALEPVSDSVRIRPGPGSANFIRYSRVRPPAVIVNRVIVPMPMPSDSTGSGKRRRQEMRVVLAHVRDIAVNHVRRRIHLMLSGDQHLCHVGLSITAPGTLT